MSDEARSLLEAYAQAVAAYARDGRSESLERGYDLGRRALSAGLGPLGALQAHSAALMRMLDAPAQEPVRRAMELFGETLGPFEMAIRGYHDTIAALRGAAANLEALVAARTEALRDAEAQYRALVERVPGTIYVASVEPAPRMVFVSPQIERLLGFTPDEWLELDGGLASRLHDGDRERVLATWAGPVPAAGGAGEYRLLAKDGRVVWVRDDAVLVEADRVQPRRRQGIWLDVTERRVLEEQLRESQKMEAVGQLAGGVAHDFNNLLTVILSYSRFAIDDLGSGHPLRPDLEEVERAAQRAAALTRQLLTFSRRKPFEPRILDLNEIVRGSEKMLRRLIGEDVDLVTTLGEGLGRIAADEGHVEQVLLNLLSNARDAMPEGGKLTLETANAGLGEDTPGAVGAREYVVLAVSDTGIGMDEPTQARIFEPFFTTKGPGRGTGLGLSTLYGIVRQAGGVVKVRSEPGRGSTFKIYFPRFGGERVEADAASARPRRGTETVLLVEDERGDRAVARRALTAAGYRVLECESPEDALRLARETEEVIHLLLTDVIMPQMTGRELADRLIEALPGLRVLFMSGYTGGALVHQGIFAAGSAYLMKPFTPDLLTKTVREVLDGAP